LVDNDNSYKATLAAYPGPENIRINKREQNVTITNNVNCYEKFGDKQQLTMA